MSFSSPKKSSGIACTLLKFNMAMEKWSIYMYVYIYIICLLKIFEDFILHSYVESSKRAILFHFSRQTQGWHYTQVTLVDALRSAFPTSSTWIPETPCILNESSGGFFLSGPRSWVSSILFFTHPFSKPQAFSNPLILSNQMKSHLFGACSAHASVASLGWLWPTENCTKTINDLANRELKHAQFGYGAKADHYSSVHIKIAGK